MYKLINEESAKMYRSYFNDFLTIKCFASCYNITVNQACDIINVGKASHEYNCVIKRINEALK